MSLDLWSFLSARADRFAHRALAGFATREAWEAARPSRHAELLESLGLFPLPERCDPALVECGSFHGPGYRARKIGYQLLPDCWGSATFYYPDPLPPGPQPGILYLCGHSPSGAEHYQSHPIRWARRGYVCLIADTIEQADNPGEHHGFGRGLEDEWLSLGYSGAGGEVWNSLRALDVLAADPAVDAARLAATGVSGGGACSFFLAAMDERVRAVSSLCGVSTPRDAVTHRHLLSHCDCFYPYNLHGRDWSDFAALIAPRAALFCFADHDFLFHPAETAAFVERTRRVYRLYDREANCKLVTCSGPHGDHPEFDTATADWFDRHLTGGARSPLERGGREVPETETSIFNGVPPRPNRLHLLPQLLTPEASLALPKDAAEWPALREQAVAPLRRYARSEPDPGPLEMVCQGEWQGGKHPAGPVKVTQWRAEWGGLPLWFQHAGVGEALPTLLSVAGAGETIQHAYARAAEIADPAVAAFAGLEPRLAGGRCPTPERRPPFSGGGLASPRAMHVRAMALTGTTPVALLLEDILALAQWWLGPGDRGPLFLHGRGEAGVAALYATVLEERIAGVLIEDAPATHRTAAPLLGILRHLDLPHAVGLVAPRPVALLNPEHGNWHWPRRLYERLGHPGRFLFGAEARAAFRAMLA